MTARCNKTWIEDRAILHIALHLLVPLALAIGCYRCRWRSSYALLLAGLLIDLDHLLASPIYSRGRCSLGFYPLHTAIPILL